MKETDIIIIGTSPTGLFAVFEAGLLHLECHLIDTLPQVDRQLTELYPKKPIFDVSDYPNVGVLELIGNLVEQIKQYRPEFTSGETTIALTKNDGDAFIVTTDAGTQVKREAVAIAGGLGTFEPHKPELENIAQYEGKGIAYLIRNPESYAGRYVVVAGDGDSALDWSICLAEKVNTASVTLVHRRDEFREALDPVEKVKILKAAGKISLKTPYEVAEFVGENQLEKVVLEQEGGNKEELIADTFIPLFGLTPKPGPIATWGVEIEKNAVRVDDALNYQTCIEGVYVIDDVNTYPGKLKLIFCGFHEATLICRSMYNRIYPNKKYVLKYTAIVSVDGFNSTRKEAEKAVIKSID